MSIGIVPPWPRRLTELEAVVTPAREDELAALQAARAAGVRVAKLVVVPAELEERFYRWNTLPERLLELFAHVDPEDPDEDDLEELAPEAQALIEEHYLLDEFVDAFYDRIDGLPGKVRVRRRGTEGILALRGRPALLAIKRLWAADWSFDALAARLERTGSFAIEARPILVHGADRPASDDVAEQVGRALGESVRAWTTQDGAITRIAFPARASDADHGHHP